MAVPKYHITNDYSSTTTPFSATGPGTLLMDAEAFLIMPEIIVQLDGGPWTVTINGRIDWSPSPMSSYALFLPEVGTFRSSITVGATADIAGYDLGVYTSHATDIVNNGVIRAVYGTA